MLQANRTVGAQRNVTARPASFGDTEADVTALIPGIRPVLLLIKQVDQVSALNGRLRPAGRQDLHRIVGVTYSAPARMPVANSRAAPPSRVKIARFVAGLSSVMTLFAGGN